jgi:hypothetical protein
MQAGVQGIVRAGGAGDLAEFGLLLLGVAMYLAEDEGLGLLRDGTVQQDGLKARQLLFGGEAGAVLPEEGGGGRR